MKKLFVALFFAPVLLSAQKAAFSFDETKKLVAPVEITFQNTSEKAETYLWDFGAGQTSTEANPTFRFTSSGNHVVKLTATKGKKSKTVEKTIQIKAPERCLVELETSFGMMTIELSNATPKHRDNFLKLAEEGFYDGTLFHRVINGFMIQGGDPDSKNATAGKQLGMGGPGYQVPAEFVDSLCHVKGALSAARMGDQANPQRASSGSQFYVVQGGPVDENTLRMLEARAGKKYTPEQIAEYAAKGGTPHLDFQYTVFGRVVKGLEIIDQIAAVKTAPGDRPKEDVKMKMRVIK